MQFLQKLRDKGVTAWQRLQAARSLEWYQSLVLETAEVDFSFYKTKLGELAERELRSRANVDPTDSGMPGEGQPGVIDANEPQPVQAMRARMRVLHHPRSTEEAYVSWVRRFIRHLDDEALEKYGESETARGRKIELLSCRNQSSSRCNARFL